MKIQEAYLILLDKLNALGTNYSQKIVPHVAMRSMNEAIGYWYDDRLRLVEANETIQRELQSLIKTKRVGLSEFSERYNAYLLPNDFYSISKVSLKASNDCCEANLVSTLKENKNIEILYTNGLSTPDFEFEQTFHTLKTGQIFVYKKDFRILEVNLDYYKKIPEVDMATNYLHFDGTPSKDIDLILEGSSAYEIIEITAKLLAGNLQDPRYQVFNQIAKENK